MLSLEPLSRAARHKIGDQRRAEVCVAAAAVLEQIEHRRAEVLKICTVDDGAALTLTRHQARIRHDRQVCRHRVLWHADQAREFAGRNALRFPLDQEPEGLKARWLR